jgi:hypothetical protein
MDKDQIAKIKNPKFQQLFQNAIEAAKYRLVAEVIESKGCHSGHVVGQRLIFDNSGNLVTKEKTCFYSS